MLPSKTSDGVPRKRRRGDHSAGAEHALAEEESQKAKNLKVLTETPDAEKCLEELVFGGEDEFVERLAGVSKTGKDPSADLLDSDSDDEHQKTTKAAKRPAWVDEEDEQDESIEMTPRYRKGIMKSKAEKQLSNDKLQLRLKEEFEKSMGGVPSWAKKSSKKKSRNDEEEDDDESEDDDDDDDEDNLLSKTGNLLAKSETLPRGVLGIRKCLNANQERRSTMPLTSVQFHPSASVIMTSSFDHSVSLFQVDGKLNPKIQSIYLEECRVFKARFSADGEKVIATGKWKKKLYVYDMIAGGITEVNVIRGLGEKYIEQFEVSPDGSMILLHGSAGYLHLLSMKTKELIGSMKANLCAVGTGFSPDGNTIFSHTADGEVYIWDVKSRRCMNRFTDDGSICGKSLAVSKDGRYVSCGSNSGVVNVYNLSDCMQERHPKPLKSIMNLVTAATSQVYNPQTEILALASSSMNEAVKLVHIPSFTVFSNFPSLGKRKTIHLTQAMDFSPNSGFFSIANNKGEALLYRLKHYSSF